MGSALSNGNNTAADTAYPAPFLSAADCRLSKTCGLCCRGFLSLPNKCYHDNRSHNNFGQREKRTSNLLISDLNRSSTNIYSFTAKRQDLFLSLLQKRDALVAVTTFVLLLHHSAEAAPEQAVSEVSGCYKSVFFFIVLQVAKSGSSKPGLWPLKFGYDVCDMLRPQTKDGILKKKTCDHKKDTYRILFKIRIIIIYLYL